MYSTLSGLASNSQQAFAWLRLNYRGTSGNMKMTYMFIGTFAGVSGRKSPLFLGDIRSTSEKSTRFDLQRGLLSCLVMTELGRVGSLGGVD